MCRSDTHPEASILRQQRIRAYRTTRIIDLNGCRTSRINRVKSYLIIDNAGEEDGGEYTLNVTVTHPDFTPTTVFHSVNTSIDTSISMCMPPLYNCAWLLYTHIWQSPQNTS